VSTPISLEKFTELAHRTASRYSHRSELEKVAYTFLPHTLEDFHRQVCAAIEANTPAVPDDLCDDDLSELAHSANQEALSFGLSHDVFLRYFITIRNRALSAAPQPQPVAQPAGDSHESINETNAVLASRYFDLLKVVEAYESHGVTCQTFRHFVESPCAECNSVAQPVQAQPIIRMWHDRIKDEHPTSEPEYWPNALKVEYMEREILDLRAVIAQPKPVNQQKED